MDALPFLLLALPLVVGCAATRTAADAPMAAGTDAAFSHTLRVDASPDAVWQIWTDVAGWPRWDTELDSAALDGPFEVGARGRLRPKSGPSARFVVTEVEPGRRYVFETSLPLAKLRVERVWRAAPDGQTEITHAVSFRGWLGGLWASRFGPTFRRALPPVMERVRALAEAAP